MLRIQKLFGAVLAFSAALIVAAGAYGHEVDVKDLRILHPYTHEPVGAPPYRLAVYMTVKNTGTAPDRLVAASSPLATGAAIVGPRATANGSMALPGGAETVLGPETAYVELTGVTSEIAGYEYFPVWLQFEVAGRVEAEIFVEERR